MSYRVSGAVIASLSAVTLLLAPDQSVARSGGAMAPAAAAAAPAVRGPVAPGARFHHHRGVRGAWNMWPAGGGFFYDPSGSEGFAGLAPQLSNDVRYTYTYDVPWDWVHRYPPNVVPSDRPYVPSCPTEQVTVPGRGGAEHTAPSTSRAAISPARSWSRRRRGRCAAARSARCTSAPSRTPA